VEEGNRTLSLAKLVGSLKSDGISAENAISLLLAWNLRNNPPLPDDDVIKQVNDMYNRYPQSKIRNARRSAENQPVPSNQSVPARQISCLPYSPVIPVGFHVQIEVLDGREVLEESVLAVRVEKDGITHYFSLCTPFFIAEYINTRTGKKQLLKSMNGKEVVVDVTLSDVKTFEKEVVGTLIGNTMSRRTITILIDYLETYHHANKRYIETVDGIETTGWCGDTFYLPSRNQSGIRWMDKKLCKIFSIEGSREKQYPFMTFLLNKPAGLPLLMAFTAPLLDRFKIRNTTLHVTGYPHTGKTCSVHAAMSLYGNPELLYNTWNSTRVGKELFSSTFSDLPIWLDEWETAGVNINEIINQIYDFEGGKGKTRGTKSLRLQEEHHYRGILLSTGEKDLDSLIEGLKATRAVPRGAYRRVIEVVADEHYFKSFNEETAPPQDTIHDTIDKIYRFTSRNYGWVGSDWIEFIEKRENLEAIYGLLKENLKLFKNTGGMNTLFALMVSIIQSSFFGFLQEEDRNAITSYIVQLAEHQGKRVLITKNITEEFISKLSDYCMCNSKHFIGIANSDDVLEKYGLWGQVTLGEGGHVFILRSTFEEMCKKFGFVKNQVLKELAKEDKLITTESDGYFTRKQIYGFKYRGYLIKGVFSEVEDQVDAVIPITPKVMFPSEDSKEWKEVEINADSKRYK